MLTAIGEVCGTRCDQPPSVASDPLPSIPVRRPQAVGSACAPGVRRAAVTWLADELFAATDLGFFGGRSRTRTGDLHRVKVNQSPLGPGGLTRILPLTW